MRWLLLTVGFIFITACASNAPTTTDLQATVTDRESAFAQTMADRDFAAFTRFLHPDTIFFAGESEIRGSQAVADAWRPFFQSPAAPFSWKPVTVAVHDGGELALSSGPVYDPGGNQVGVFNSIWQRQPDGRWLILFDKGGQYCPPANQPD